MSDEIRRYFMTRNGVSFEYYVIASDYDKLACLVDPGHKLTMDAACGEIAALEAERDELRAQVEAMRAALTPEALDWLRCGLSTNGRLIDGTHPALEKVRAVYAALQAKP